MDVMPESLGRYVLDVELGRGGMSVVYRAVDPALDRTVALKVLHPHLAGRADSRQRFTREARAVARLAHLNIVEVFDYSPPQSERAYIVTEFIDGPTLKQFVDANPIRHSELAALLMIPIFEALEHAHRAGIIHRDVKPENIMLRPDGTPVLMDFGIAQMVDMETLTATGTMLGSPAHMAPEVVQGEPVNHRADLFSGGTVLYWLVCEALPFSGPNPAALFRRILECRFDPVLQRRPRAGRSFARLIEACLARSPDERPTSAGEIAARLTELLAVCGLTDLRTELAAYIRDPAVYQDELVHRLPPRYAEAARVAADAGLTARALDFLDRALALDPDNVEALRLLDRIERGQRKRGVVRLAAVTAVCLAATIAVWMNWPATSGALTIEDRFQPVASRSYGPTHLSGIDAAVEVPDAATESPDAQTEARRDAGRRRVNIVGRTRPRRRRPRPVAPPDAALPTAPTKVVEVKVMSESKAPMVYVDNVLVGNIGSIQGANHLRLEVGRKHTVLFRSPKGCRQLPAITVDLTRTDKAYPLVYKCKPEQARVRIASNHTTNIFRNNKLFGRTNQDITVDMDDKEQWMSLTVGSGTLKFRKVSVLLKAGETTERKVRF